MPILQKKQAMSQQWHVEEMGFEPGFLLPVVVMSLRIPIPHSSEPLGTVGLGMC